jgi:hypothetical protein
MEDKKENTNFVNFGTYKAEEADILKYELEKQEIPVKVLYPGTEIGREATARTYPAYKLMIRVCDFEKAKEVIEKFNIKPIREEEMPLPKTYIWVKRGLNRILLIGYLVSLFVILIESLSDKRNFIPKNIILYFVVLFFISFFIWIGSAFYNIFKKKKD